MAGLSADFVAAYHEAAKRGEKKKSELKGPSKKMAESMSEKELKKLASTKRKKLPKRKS